MGGGLMQLVAYGAQDIYLTGNPQITFFKVVYRRHTNFSMETIAQTLNGSGTITDGTNSTCTVSRNGDLVSKVYVNFLGTSATDGSAAINEVELEIGGQRIDRHYQEWNEVWNELTTPESKAIGLKSMQRCIGGAGTGVTNVQVPLNFWFCRNPGLALPLIALQYHEVKMKFTWGSIGASGTVPTVYCDYIYLDTDERRRFAQVSHEYLIEQLQREEKTGGTSEVSHKLNFNHPVKELIWTSDAGDTLSKVKLTLNGHDRFSEQDEEYFSLRQPFDYHTAVPAQNLPIAARTSLLNGVYPLTVAAVAGLNPETTGGVANSAAKFAMPDVTTLELTDANVTALGLSVGTATAGETLAIITNAHGNTNQYTTADPSDGTLYTATVHSVGAVNTTHNGVAPGAGAQVVQLNVGFQDASTSAAAFPTAIAAGAADGVFALFSLDANSVTTARTSKMVRKIGVYSFALKPEEHQPSGTCNFSRIDTAQLKVTHTTATNFTIYAVNYNVLRIMSGMGGLAYSN
tara:strand:- start:314 stop:1864 length:1551 start_codon:yes stop_codon:yes gene_type:complete